MYRSVCKTRFKATKVRARSDEKFPVRGLDEANVDPNPYKQFGKWFQDAARTRLPFPDSMTLATATKSGRPSARTLLLRSFDERGFVFYTNYTSRKARELSENPWASMVFYWPTLSRQVRLEGRIAKVSVQESNSYFATRPRGHQLATWASHQSRAVQNRRVLENRFKKFNTKYRGWVPRPDYWGGYKLTPNIFEFWKGRVNRLHDRIRYKKQKQKWIVERLAP